jgi:hypothetical protein
MHHVLWTCTLVLGLLLAGCADLAYWNAKTFYGIDCRPEKLQNGQCVPVKKGGSNVTTAQP